MRAALGRGAGGELGDVSAGAENRLGDWRPQTGQSSRVAAVPIVPFWTENDAAECRPRQLACLKWLDGVLELLLAAFADANIVVCGDHGDAWGEDGVWEHGIHHPRSSTSPSCSACSTPPRRAHTQDARHRTSRTVAPAVHP